MRVLAVEYITGGGLTGRNLPFSLAREGDMMLTTLLRELAGVPDVGVFAARDPRLPVPDLGACFVVPMAEKDVWDLWERATANCDALWPIAPESQGALERLSAIARRCGKRLIGSSEAAIAVAASKRATAELLARHGIPVIETREAKAEPPPSRAGWVVKPDDGAGAEETRYFSGVPALSAFLARRTGSAPMVVQPFLEGEAASMSVLFRDGEAGVLACNAQDVQRNAEGNFFYRGFEVGGREDARGEFEALARKIGAALPGLFGYVGIDLVMTGNGAVVLEINPRLTTSYVGLGPALDCNVAWLVLGLANGSKMPSLRPRRSVRVAVDGPDG